MTSLCSQFTLPISTDPNAPSSVKVLLWKLVSITIFPYLPSPLYKLRRIILRTFGATMDPHARVRGGVRISHPWNLTIGRKSSIGEGTQVYNPAPLTIGDRSVISQYCYVSCVSSDSSSSTSNQLPAPLTIGDDVWIATECVIEGNQSIPCGLLVGARSLISNNYTPEPPPLSPWTIATGHPARSRRDRDYQGIKTGLNMPGVAV